MLRDPLERQATGNRPPDTAYAASTVAPAGRSRRSWAIWGVTIVVLAVVAYVVFAGSSRDEAQRRNSGRASSAPAAGGRRGGPPVMPVVGAVARQGTMPVYLNGLGTVTSLNNVTVRSRVDGQLMSVAFKEGQLVRKGEVLAQIDPRPFQVQVAQGQGQLAKDEAALKNAQMDLQRYQVLFAQDAVPRQQLDTAIATVNQFQGVVQSDQALIESARLNLTYSRITAPVSGRVGLRLVDPGNMVHANDPNGIVTITERQPIGVLFTIPGDALPPVLREMHAGRRLTVEAWDRDLSTRLATGTLLSVDNAIDPATGTVRLKAQFANEDESLFPNQFVNARLLVDTLRNTVLVPAAAIQRNQQSTFVYLVTPENKVELRPVTVARTEGDVTAVTAGLAGGEAVVVEGVDKLQPGMKVAMRVPEQHAGPRTAPGSGSGNGARGSGMSRQNSAGGGSR